MDLNSYQHKLRLKDSGNCECGNIEIVEHFLLVCPKFENIREQMKQNLYQTIGISYMYLDLKLLLNVRPDNEFKNDRALACMALCLSCRV